MDNWLAGGGGRVCSHLGPPPRTRSAPAPPGSRPFTAALPPFHAPLCLDFFVGRSPSSLSIPWLTFFAFLDAFAIFFWSARHFRGDPKPARAGFWLLEAGYEPVGSEKMGISRPPQYRACIPPITTKTQFSSRYHIFPFAGSPRRQAKKWSPWARCTGWSTAEQV